MRVVVIGAGKMGLPVACQFAWRGARVVACDVKPETAAIESASRQIAKGLKPGTLVSYETTLPVGGSRKLAATLEESGLEAGVDFGFVLRSLTENAKVVGGINSRSAERGASFYAQYLGAPAENVHTLEAAELVK